MLAHQNFKKYAETDVLYSLSHSYITWVLIAQKAGIEVLAKQCDTSIQMIEQHYSHVIPRMHTEALSGVDLGIDVKQIENRFDVAETAKATFTKWAKEWQANYRQRGCI